MSSLSAGSFARDARGFVAILFALSLPALMITIGASVDYGRALVAQTVMQAAVDSTAVGLVREAGGLSQSSLQQQATARFDAGIGQQDLSNVVVATSFTSGAANTLNVQASATFPTTVMRIFGVDSIDIGASSTVTYGNGPRLRVALVLDNTGSMSQSGKLAALKTAAGNLLQTLQTSATTPDDAYVSIVPFTTDVNVGPANSGAGWIDWTDWDSQNGTCSKRGSTQASCSGTWTPASHSQWDGCLTDRGFSSGPSPSNYDTNVVPPQLAVAGTLFPAQNVANCPSQVLPLTNDWSSMTTLINAMTAGGNTNQAIGLAHGWASLVGIGPYPTPPPYDSHYQYKLVIILLSDGLNTADRWYTSASSIDARQRMTCDNIHQAGVTLYTIQVDTGSDPTSSVLQYCASDASKFYLLTTANQIVDAFQQIGSDLQQLRIAR